MILEDNLTKAQKIYDYMAARGDFMQPGRRNDHAVDFCIACRVLHMDPILEFRNIACRKGFSRADMALCEEHIERIIPYLDVWGPDGEEDDALDYTIDDWD